MSTPPSDDDLLVNAWASTTGESNAARFSRMSLEMFASEVPELASTLSRLQLDGRATAVLNLVRGIDPYWHLVYGPGYDKGST